MPAVLQLLLLLLLVVWIRAATCSARVAACCWLLLHTSPAWARVHSSRHVLSCCHTSLLLLSFFALQQFAGAIISYRGCGAKKAISAVSFQAGPCVSQTVMVVGVDH